MSKKHGISPISMSMSAVLDRCKRTATKYWRLAGQVIWPAKTRCLRDQGDVAPPECTTHELQLGTCHSPVELKEVAEVLSIGDRIRVFCDDGVVVAEKISPTQFKLIDCQMISESLH